MFELSKFLLVDPAGHDAVGNRSFFQRGQSGNVLILGRDNDLAADFVLDVVLLAELHHGRSTDGAGLGLLAARFVVDPRVEHAGVVARLVAGEFVAFLQQCEGGARGASQQL
ncbi:MAG: hypothetical protein R2706_14885 [Acidimicrobiales bacterium]